MSTRESIQNEIERAEADLAEVGEQLRQGRVRQAGLEAQLGVLRRQMPSGVAAAETTDVTWSAVAFVEAALAPVRAKEVAAGLREQGLAAEDATVYTVLAREACAETAVDDVKPLRKAGRGLYVANASDAIRG